MSKWIVYLGGNFLDIRIIKSIKKYGFNILLVDRSKKSPCIKYSDLFVNQNVNSKKEVFNDINQKLIKDSIHGVLESGEFAIETAAFLRKKFNLKGLKDNNLKKIINKIYQKELFHNIGIKTPQYQLTTLKKLLEDDYSDLSFPLVVKIPESFGGKNVWICKEQKDLEKTIKQISKLDYKKEILLEDFIKGQEFAISGFIKNKNIYDFTSYKVKRRRETAQLEYGILNCANDKNEILKNSYELLLKIANNFNISSGIVSANLLLFRDQLFCIEFTTVTSQLLINAQELFLKNNILTDFFREEKVDKMQRKNESENWIFGFQQIFNNDPIFRDIKNINITKEYINSLSDKNFIFFRDLNSENLECKEIKNLAAIFVFDKNEKEVLVKFKKYKLLILELIKKKST